MAAALQKTKSDIDVPVLLPQWQQTAHLPAHPLPPKKKRTVKKNEWKEITTESGDVVLEKEPMNQKKTLKLRVHPSERQKRRLKSWFEIYRLVYNHVATYVNKQPTPCPVKLSMIALRKAVDTNDSAWPKLTGNNPTYKDAHSDLRQSAFMEISTAIKTARQHGFPTRRKIYFKNKRKKDRFESKAAGKTRKRIKTEKTTTAKW